jgi:tetratricopeptide (TPR) repeat protein
VSDRVVEVAASSTDGTQYGTGFVVASQLVLTAGHVVTGTDRVTVRALADGVVRTCRILWYGSATDAALLEVVDSGRRHDPVRMGRFVAADEVACQFVGFPRFQLDRDVGNDTEQVYGTISPVTGAVSGRWQVRVTGEVPPAGWTGVAGAAVFTAEFLVGIVTEELRGFTPRRLRVEPVWRVVAEAGFAASWQQATGTPPPELEAADLGGALVTRNAPPPVRSPGAVLRPEVAAVRFTGRAAELEQMLDWCQGDGLRVHLVTGPAGAGKSRLALHLSALLRRSGWMAGGLRPAATGVDRLNRLTQPMLCVVDYAETRGDELAALLEAVRHELSGAPLRLLLLARTDREWYERLQSRFALLVPDPIRLGPLAGTDDGASFAAAARDIAAAVRALPRGWPIGDPEALRPPDQPARSPLALQATALAALLQSGSSALAVPEGSSVWEVLLRHERAYWDRAAHSHGITLPDGTRSELVAATVLCEPRDRGEARGVAGQVLRAGDPHEPGPRSVAEWLRDLYPSWVPGDGFWDGPRPDRLAEHLVMNTLADEPDLPVRVLSGASAQQRTAALTVLSRASAHRAEAAEVLAGLLAALPDLAMVAVRVASRSEHPGPLVAAIDRLVSSGALTAEALWELDEEIPVATQVLSTVAVRSGQALVDACARLADRDPEQARELAVALHQYANRLTLADRFEEALAVHQHALDILVRDDGPARESSALLAAMIGTAGAYADAGRADEAVDMLRTVVAALSANGALAEPDQLPWRVILFGALAARLVEAGRLADAVEAGVEAVESARRAVARTVESGVVLLSAALTGWQAVLAAAGRDYDAAAAADELVGICRARPGTGELSAELGWALNKLADRLGPIGQLERQLAAARESTAIFRALAAVDRDARLPDLAEALSRLHRCLYRTGHRDESVEACAEHVAVLRTLASLAPGRYRMKLSDALDEYAERLAGADCVEDARAAVAEADLLRDRPPGNGTTHHAGLSADLRR